MAAADAGEFIVRDVSTVLGGESWRWGLARPELRFVLQAAEGLKLRVDFGLVETTLAQTGPVNVSFFVNGRLLGRMRCAAPGDRRFEAPVPADWLRMDSYTHVVIEPDKVYVSPQDGAKLSLTLYRAGFVQ